MSSEGWIKLWRKFRENAYLRDANRRAIFVTLLVAAQHKRCAVNLREHTVELRRGEVAIAQKDLAAELRLSRKQIRTALGYLERGGLIAKAENHSRTIVGPSRNHPTILSVCNFDAYQDEGPRRGHGGATEGPTEQECKEGGKKEPPSEAPKKAPRSPPSGSRLPADWSPSEIDVAYARKQGFANGRIEGIAESFRDYWLSKAGAAARKSDWAATWRTWVRREAERSNGSGLPSGERGGPGGHPSDARGRAGPGSVAEAARRLLHRQN